MGTSRGRKMVLRKWEMKMKSRRRDLRGVKPGRWKRREENGRLKTERATAEKSMSVVLMSRLSHSSVISNENF